MKIIRALQVHRRVAYFGLTLFVLCGIYLGMFGLENMDELEIARQDTRSRPRPAGNISLVIKVPARSIEVYADEQLYKKYACAVGKSNTPTPVGEWKVVSKDYGWGTGFGTRWMGLNVPWGIYGIHGTNKPWSIGRFASHGCIRMRNKDVEELFEWVPVGTIVHIEGKKTRVSRDLKYQKAGPDVVTLQLKLKELGYLTDRADGLFGSATDKAVKQYQLDKGLEENGIVDKNLRSILGI